MHRLFVTLSFLPFLYGMILLSCARTEDEKSYPLNVPAGFEISQAVSTDLIAYPMFASFDDKGRLFVFEATEVNNMGTETMATDPSYRIRRLEDSDGDGQFDISVIYADQLPFPMGGTYIDGSLYVAASPDLLRLTDLDGDGIA
ncbi:MAG: hypothetical protein HKN76_05380, partial [Saprospiraceae bacterium]|nr:hypothetical protein [Saprospiraceae bacterium]